MQLIPFKRKNKERVALSVVFRVSGAMVNVRLSASMGQSGMISHLHLHEHLRIFEKCPSSIDDIIFYCLALFIHHRCV